jgi:hypothetical protein
MEQSFPGRQVMIYGIVENLLAFFCCVIIEIFFLGSGDIVSFVLSFGRRRPGWADRQGGFQKPPSSFLALKGLVFRVAVIPLLLNNLPWPAGAFGF